MADSERGGRRTPPARSGPAGPGRFSKRDERVQPIREPDLDNPDIEYGDVQRLTEAQRIARLPSGGARSPAQRLRGELPQPAGQLPPWMFEMPSAFPEEPVSAGLGMGPGPGPEMLQTQQPPEDIREATLAYLAQNFGNADAQQVLAQLRQERSQPVAPQSGAGIGPPRTPLTENMPMQGEPPQIQNMPVRAEAPEEEGTLM